MQPFRKQLYLLVRFVEGKLKLLRLKMNFV